MNTRGKKVRNITNGRGNLAVPGIGNSFQALELIQLEGFENEELVPLAIESPQRDYKQLYKAKRGQKPRAAH